MYILNDHEGMLIVDETNKYTALLPLNEKYNSPQSVKICRSDITKMMWLEGHCNIVCCF